MPGKKKALSSVMPILQWSHRVQLHLNFWTNTVNPRLRVSLSPLSVALSRGPGTLGVEIYFAGSTSNGPCASKVFSMFFFSSSLCYVISNHIKILTSLQERRTLWCFSTYGLRILEQRLAFRQPNYIKNPCTASFLLVDVDAQEDNGSSCNE